MAVTPPPTGSSPAAGVAAGLLLSGRYRLDDQLASGGMAQVWRGTDEVLRRSVAVKILHPHLAADDTFVARFRQEAIAVARLSHPAIVNVYDTCSADGVEAIVMELVRGQTLRQRLDSGALGPWVAANIAAQVAGALDVAHAAGLVHRDIKPANIMLSDDGRVKVGDFGIAKAAESADLTQEGSFVGTAKYLAPEQVEGKAVDGRTDLYSLGVVLYEMLCGRVPFEADGSSATALARLHQDPQRPRLIRPGIPRELEGLTMRLLARDPDGRFSSASETRAALLSAGADEATEANALPPPPPPGPQTHAQGQPHQPYTTPNPGLPAPPRTNDNQPGFAQSERRWLVPTLLVVLAAAALAVAGLLIGGSGAGDLLDTDPDTETTEAASDEPLELTTATPFDPTGGDGENSEDIALVTDGASNPDQTWSTEWYRDREFGNLKTGVGFYVVLPEETDVSAVEINSPSNDWSAEIFVADAASETIDGWGDAVGQVEHATPGLTRIELDEPVAGKAVLVWFTYLGDAPTSTGQFAVDVAEVQVFD